MQLYRIIFFALSSLFWATAAHAQCDTWVGKPNQDDLIQDHVIYKGFLKENKPEQAFAYWQKVYKEAPYADGKRTDHFYDGQQLYIKKYESATTEADKEAFRNAALAIFDQEAECTGSPGPAYGRKGYYMFYNLASPYLETYKALKTSLDALGNNAEYIILVPMAYVLVDQYKNKRITDEEARDVFSKLVALADYNIANNKQFSAQYQQGKDAMMPTLAQIEGSLFDCAWFKNKLEPKYRADPENGELIKEIYLKLANQECGDTDPLMVELKSKYEAYAAEVNAQVLAEFYEKNPGSHAKALYDEGKYSEAIEKYKIAIEQESDQEKLADYYQALGSIEFRQFDRYTTAREHARKALKLRPNWGQPLILIGDMYAKSYRSCGNSDFEQRCVILAAMEKYYAAKAIDPSVADQVNERLSRFMSSRPSHEDAHMLGLKEGQSYSIGCWIGETVTLQFNK
ncbi:MAG: tetratricopeptide repeat protein [Saprospiraceae bacterium]|nr:tetratricopeptide repeat protein [Saprospiraceae bacterium]